MQSGGGGGRPEGEAGAVGGLRAGDGGGRGPRTPGNHHPAHLLLRQQPREGGR